MVSSLVSFLYTNLWATDEESVGEEEDSIRETLAISTCADFRIRIVAEIKKKWRELVRFKKNKV